MKSNCCEVFSFFEKKQSETRVQIVFSDGESLQWERGLMEETSVISEISRSNVKKSVIELFLVRAFRNVTSKNRITIIEEVFLLKVISVLLHCFFLYL